VEKPWDPSANCSRLLFSSLFVRLTVTLPTCSFPGEAFLNLGSVSEMIRKGCSSLLSLTHTHIEALQRIHAAKHKLGYPSSFYVLLSSASFFINE